MVPNPALQVLVVPPNKPCIRKDHPRQLHITDADALQEVDYVIKGAWVSGRPLLIGTASTSASERIYNYVAETLEKERRGMEETINYNAHQGKHGDDLNGYRRLLHKLENVHIALLNSDESLVQQESMIVAQAGMFGHVTVATNMAGRGTDILLGGNPSQLCGLLLAQPYNQHFVNLYAESSQNADSSNGSEEGLAAMEAVAWRNSFDPITNVTARRLLTEWKQRIQQSQRSGGLLHSRFQLVFEAIIESHMTPNTPTAWDAKQCASEFDYALFTCYRYTEWMKRLQEVVLPLMLYVENRLPEVSKLRLDADQNPPYLTDLDQNANDPLLQRIPVYEISDDPDTPTALTSAVMRALSNGKTSIEGSDVICAVCAAAVEDALEKETLVLDKDMPADAVTYALVAHAWLAWFSAQQRKLIMLGGTYTAENAAQAVANGGQWEQGGLIVLQWGAAHNVRVERQLRGRAGRQGDPGESHVIISLEDPTMYPLQESFKAQESFLSQTPWNGSFASEIITSHLPSQLAKEYRMRVQNEDAVLFADVKRDVSLDRWRTMHEHLRMSVLHADRSMLLAAYCGMFRQLISELLQAPRVRVQRGRWGFGRVPTGDVVTADKAGGEGLGPAIDCRLHPRTWDLQAIAQLMDEIVNSYYENSEGPTLPWEPKSKASLVARLVSLFKFEIDAESMGIITFEVISEVNAVILQEFLDKGHGTLPYPGSEVSSLDLWYACNLESSSKAQQPSVPAALVDALLGGSERLWEGRFASQAQMLTKYLAQLLLTRLVQKEKLSMTHAAFHSTHLRMPILKALDHAWQCVIIEEHAIQTCQGLDSLAALDPEAEYKARVADSFTMHYRKVAEAASRKIFADLNEETSSKPQWVAVQKARYRTPTDAAGDDEDASGSE